jgi:RNA polymerase sigma factor (sigma-70 family)
MANAKLGMALQHVRDLADARVAGQAFDGQLLERFANRRDEAAFATLLRRHGPMVLGVCRRILGHAQDAEDVFQATFLLLACKAGSIRKRDSVGSWLHGVAARLALKARTQRIRRQGQERQAAAMSKTPTDVEEAGRELQAMLDEALRQLPEKYRAPLVLCYLEGKTHEEACRQLGCPLATLRSWVARGRSLLRTRLARRGLVLSEAAVATALLASTAVAAVPAALLHPTLKAAVGFAAEGATAGLVTAQVAALVQGGLKAMAMTRVKIGLALVAVLGLLATGVGVISHQVLQAQTHQARDRAQPKPAPAEAERARGKERAQVRTDRQGELLPAGALVRLGTVRFRHGSTVTGLAYTADGKGLISASYDKTVRVWDPASGRERQRLPALAGSVYQLAISWDGKTVAACDGMVYVGALATGRLTRLPLPQAEYHICLALSPDGRLLAAGSGQRGGAGGPARLWEVVTGKELHAYHGHKGEVRCLAFSPDGKTLATGGDDGTVRLWATATGKECHRLECKGRATALAFSRDGKVLAVGDRDRTLRLWEMPTAKPLQRLRSDYHYPAVEAIAISPDRKLVAAAGSGGPVCLWDAVTGKEVRRMWAYANAVAFSPDGRTLASGGHHCTIQLWDVATGKECTPGKFGHDGPIRKMAVSADGTIVATSGGDRLIRLWDRATGKELRVLRPDNPYPSSVALSPSGKLVASNDRIWDRASGKLVGQLKGQDYSVEGLVFSPDSRTLATATLDTRAGKGRMIRLWDVATARVSKHFGEQPVQSLGWSPDGRTLAAGNHDGTIALWDVATGRARHRLRGHRREIDSVAFSPDGRLLASSTFDGDILLWDAAAGRQLRRFDRGEDRQRYVNVSGVAFAPNCKMLATAEGPTTSRKGNCITLWEVATGRVRLRLKGHQGHVNCLAFAGDSRTLVSCSTDTTALVWDVTAPLRPAPVQAGNLSRKRLEALWTDLRVPDATQGFRAICVLATSPDSAHFLGQRLRQPALDQGRIVQLVKSLDSERFGEREKARKELERLGEAAEPALRKALAGQPSVEVRQRLSRLLEGLTSGWLRTQRTVETLELLGTPEARQVLRSLAAGTPEARLTREAKAALECLARQPTAPR